jgi:hypothetical protein
MKAGAARRLLASLAVAWLLLACAPLAPAALADDPTPGPDTVNVDPGKEPLMPYIVALLVASGVLVVVGVVAVQVNRASGRRAGAGRGLALWTCPACGTTNAGDRETCYACGAARTRAPD